MKFAFSPAAVAKVRRELNSIIAVFYLQTGIKFALHAPRVCISASEERLEWQINKCDKYKRRGSEKFRTLYDMARAVRTNLPEGY
jgi:hypothetical protein